MKEEYHLGLSRSVDEKKEGDGKGEEEEKEKN